MDGVINLLKPPGMTSNDLVYDVRRIVGVKRVGHTGTLDPGAVGVLPICVGKATRLFDYLMEKEKEYVTEVVFGAETNTLDSYGEITEENDRIVSPEELCAVLPKFLGEINQLAPMYSAVSVNGQRLYKLARKGIEVERKQRTAVIYSNEIISQISKNRFLFKTRCSKGTYVRTLFNDIAKELGTYSYVSFLLRSKSGRFTLDDAITVDELKEHSENGTLDSVILPTDEALDFLPAVYFKEDAQTHKRLINGATVPYSSDGLFRAYYDDSFLGIGECTKGEFRIKTQL